MSAKPSSVSWHGPPNITFAITNNLVGALLDGLLCFLQLFLLSFGRGAIRVGRLGFTMLVLLSGGDIRWHDESSSVGENVGLLVLVLLCFMISIGWN